MDPPRSHRIRTGGAELHVREWADRGDPVVLLHGGPGLPDYLAPVASLLRRGYRPVTYDQRGSGRSRAVDGSYRIEDHVQDLDGVLAHFGFRQVHLFGHSWGGLLAQLFTARHPRSVRSLFLSNSATGLGPDWERAQGRVKAFHLRPLGPWGRARMRAFHLASLLPGRIGDEGTRRLYRQAWRNFFLGAGLPAPDDLGWIQATRGKVVRGARASIRAADPALLEGLGPLAESIPVLILYGRHDIFGEESGKLIRRFPAARSILLEEAGHLPWLQAPGAFRRIMTDFYPLLRK